MCTWTAAKGQLCAQALSQSDNYVVHYCSQNVIFVEMVAKLKLFGIVKFDSSLHQLEYLF